MKIRMVESGETREVKASLGLRLIEQDKAVPVTEKKGAPAKTKEAEKPSAGA